MHSIMMTLPAHDVALRDEIIEHLSDYAYVFHPPPSMLRAKEIQLIIEIVVEASGFLVNMAGVAGFLLALKQQYGKDVKAKSWRDGAPPKRLADMSDDEICELSAE